jgi:hypothetical protein
MDVLRKIRKISVRIEIIVSWGVTPKSLQMSTVIRRSVLLKFQGALKMKATPPSETLIHGVTPQKTASFLVPSLRTSILTQA